MGIRDLAVSRGQTVHNFKRSQLHIMPGLNARDMKSPENIDRVKDLAGKIDAKGFTSNVIIFIKDNKPYISQGHCRMAAIDLLISDGKWDEETMLIPALAENSGVGILELYSNQFTSNDSKQLAPREAAFNIMRIMNLLGQDRDRTAAQICRSRSYVDQMLKFNENASPEVHAAVEAGKISQSQAASILRKEGSKQGSETIKKVVATAEASGKKKATKRDVEAAKPASTVLTATIDISRDPPYADVNPLAIQTAAIVLARDFLERVGFDFADPATCKEAERIVAELKPCAWKADIASCGVMVMITETVAKTKMCPFIRYCVNARDACVDKYPPVYKHANCAGSNCMAWRPASTKSDEQFGECAMIPPVWINVNNNY